MKAILQSDFRKSPIEGRVIVGAKLLENNRDVTYSGADGKPVSFRTNDGLLDGLINHAGNRSIPAHLTHQWTDGKNDALLSRVGAFKNFRRSDSGDLVGDFHAMPGADGDKMLWLAEHDPEHAALSVVFEWNPIKANGVTYAVPLDFKSADFVASGAGVTAMLSANLTETDMTKEEIQALVTESVTAALKSYKPEGYITKEDADKAVQAALASHKPELTDAQKNEIALLSTAKAVEQIGKTPFLTSFEKAGDEFESAITAQLSAGAKDRPTAILRLANDKPAIYNAAVLAGKI